jgi:hypothetical protein
MQQPKLLYPQTRWHEAVEARLGQHPVVKDAGFAVDLARARTFVDKVVLKVVGESNVAMRR